MCDERTNSTVCFNTAVGSIHTVGSTSLASLALLVGAGELMESEELEQSK